MVNPNSTPGAEVTPTAPQASATDNNAPTPLRCLIGSAISGAIAVAAYAMTLSIHATFVAKPLVSDNVLALRLSVLVRTLVTGISALATFSFAIAALGLVGLAIQLLIKGTPAQSVDPSTLDSSKPD
ncbi:MAG: DUF3082 domain-containing protein [Kaiparowitsia implicata GSE-PSE-MK54-09C]|nr:DUF3082 domain-containing protein [Kaiparowitsia implicata GSE-PSE-MK54-09C]